MDETNFNIHISRRQGRSIKGSRCNIPAASSKGTNIHLIGCIGQMGKINFKLHKGSIYKEYVKKWFEKTLLIETTSINLL